MCKCYREHYRPGAGLIRGHHRPPAQSVLLRASPRDKKVLAHPHAASPAGQLEQRWNWNLGQDLFEAKFLALATAASAGCVVATCVHHSAGSQKSGSWDPWIDARAAGGHKNVKIVQSRVPDNANRVDDICEMLNYRRGEVGSSSLQQ